MGGADRGNEAGARRGSGTEGTPNGGWRPEPGATESLFGVFPSTRLVALLSLPRFLSSSSSRRYLDPAAMSSISMVGGSIWMAEELDSVEGKLDPRTKREEVESGSEELDSGGDEQKPEFVRSIREEELDRARISGRRGVLWLGGSH